MTKPLYLSEAEVRTLAPSAGVLADALARAFRDRAAGRVAMPAKTSFSMTGSDASFHAMPAAVPGVGAGVKWVAGAPANADRGLPHLDALLLLSDPDSGLVQAIVEARYLTGWRTAALSLLAARYLARPDAARLGLIGCGLQAASHCEALCEAFPIRSVKLCSRRRETAQSFAASLGERGLITQVSDEPAEVLAESDIVVTTVPAQPGLTGFLDAARLAPGAFATMVDLGRSWRAESIGAFARCFTDDRPQSGALSGSNATFAAMTFHGDLAGLASGEVPGRQSEGERIAFLFPGVALADMVAGHLLLHRWQSL